MKEFVINENYLIILEGYLDPTTLCQVGGRQSPKAHPKRKGKEILQTQPTRITGEKRFDLENWDSIIDQARQSLSAKKYALLPAVIPLLPRQSLKKYYQSLFHNGFAALSPEKEGKGSLSCSNEEIAIFIQNAIMNIVNRITGMKLQPLYVFTRRYLEHSYLPKHMDNKNHLFVISMLLDYFPEPDGPSPWPIHFEVDGKKTTLHQYLGDWVIYRGMELIHFRDPLPENHVSTSLFFVFNQGG